MQVICKYCALSYKRLEHPRLWYLEGSWNQSSVFTKGQVYLIWSLEWPCKEIRWYHHFTNTEFQQFRFASSHGREGANWYLIPSLLDQSLGSYFSMLDILVILPFSQHIQVCFFDTFGILAYFSQKKLENILFSNMIFK